MGMVPITPPVMLGTLEWTFSRTCILGVVNVTPDSFFDGGQYESSELAIEHGLELARDGADIVDVGGESTRPNADPVSTEDELSRVLPVIEGLVDRECSAMISVDTYKATVARRAVAAGASVINDISGMALDEEMAQVVTETEATIILGHLRGEPAEMQRSIRFKDVVREVSDELRERVRVAIMAGIPAERIWIDPGIGFGKTAEQSLELMRATGTIRAEVGYPILIGPSRKSFIGAVTGQPVEDRLMGTCSAVAAVVMAGADAVRIHDVAELYPAIQVADAIRRGLTYDKINL